METVLGFKANNELRDSIRSRAGKMGVTVSEYLRREVAEAAWPALMTEIVTTLASNLDCSTKRVIEAIVIDWAAKKATEGDYLGDEGLYNVSPFMWDPESGQPITDEKLYTLLRQTYDERFTCNTHLMRQAMERQQRRRETISEVYGKK